MGMLCYTCRQKSNASECLLIPVSSMPQFPRKALSKNKQQINNQELHENKNLVGIFRCSYFLESEIQKLKLATLTCQVAGILNNKRSGGTSILLYNFKRLCT